jgi:hypothetical protein
MDETTARARFDVFVATAALLAVLIHWLAFRLGVGAPTLLKALAVTSLLISAGLTVAAVRSLR